MLQYLKGHTEDIDEYQEKFFSLLENDDINVDAFIKSFKHKEHRKPFGDLIGKCFEVLKGTGTDSELCLTAFWAPTEGGTYGVQYEHFLHRWTGLLADSPVTCTLAIVTDKCLEISRGDAACQAKYVPPSSCSVLETSILINPSASLSQCERQERKDCPLPKGFKLDLGNVGGLKVLRNIRNGVVVDWSKSRLPAVRAVKSWLRSGKVKLGKAKWHNELVSWLDRNDEKVTVLVVSDKGMEVD